MLLSRLLATITILGAMLILASTTDTGEQSTVIIATVSGPNIMNPDRFLDMFGTRTGRWLANQLGLSGPGSEKLANLISNYAWNHRAAVVSMKQPNCYSNYCEQLRGDIESHALYDRVKNRIRFWV